jgi:hypothetical protein
MIEIKGHRGLQTLLQKRCVDVSLGTGGKL